MSGRAQSKAEVSARGRRVAIVAARFNDLIVSSLLKGARAAWLERGGTAQDLRVVRVPGAFELPVVARQLAESGRYDAIVALGCVIRGDTPHFEYVAGECARGLQLASLETGVPDRLRRADGRDARAGAGARRDHRRQQGRRSAWSARSRWPRVMARL